MRTNKAKEENKKMEEKIEKSELQESELEVAEIALSLAKYDGHMINQKVEYGEPEYVGDGDNYREHLDSVYSYLIHGLRVDMHYHKNEDFPKITIF